MRVRPVLILLLALVALAAAGCGGGQEVAPTAEDVQGTVETGADETATETDGATTGETETEAETETGDEADDNGGGRGNAEAGRAIYDANGCGGCHVLGAAGANGTIGPSLEGLAQAAAKRQKGTPPEKYVTEAIVNPNAFIAPGYSPAVMPQNYDSQLTPEQVKALTDYLLRAGG